MMLCVAKDAWSDGRAVSHVSGTGTSGGIDINCASSSKNICNPARTEDGEGTEESSLGA